MVDLVRIGTGSGSENGYVLIVSVVSVTLVAKLVFGNKNDRNGKMINIMMQNAFLMLVFPFRQALIGYLANSFISSALRAQSYILTSSITPLKY